MLKKHSLLSLTVAMALYVSSAAAAVSESEAAQLGRTLMPLGGSLPVMRLGLFRLGLAV